MNSFKNKVAVITGAASGIGSGIAEYCLSEGMRLVLADIEEEALLKFEEKLRASGGQTIAVTTDISKAGDVETLARKAIDAFGAVDLLFNNAGVGVGRFLWENTLADWQWVLGVNLWGVIYGIRTFVPIMLKQNTDCHIVNTASIEGLWSRPGNGPYQVTKHAVVALSEVLHHELLFLGSKIRVSVLCPGAVNTQILDSWRNRPQELSNPPEEQPEMTPEMAEQREIMREIFKSGMQPFEVARHVFKAIREEKFYIFTHPDLKEHVQRRMDNIMNERNPTPTVEQPSAIPHDSAD